MNHKQKEPLAWIPWIDGTSLRKLSNQRKKQSHLSFYRQAKQEIISLPNNTELSKKHCSVFSGILNLDGIYVKIAGYKKSIPFIYGMDFLLHDPIVSLLAKAEDISAFLTIFTHLKEMNYPLQVVVCDEAGAIEPALKRVFPNAKIQLCHTHYLKKISDVLHLKSDTTYRVFFFEMKKWLFRLPENWQERVIGQARMQELFAKEDLLLQGVLQMIQKDEHLFTYQTLNECPKTNNLIEGTNTQLRGRLKTIKGFKTFHSAERFLNAWILRRRTKPFTDCKHPFKHLNGKTSLEMTMHTHEPWPNILDCPDPRIRSRK